jgi:hypothetical protein
MAYKKSIINRLRSLKDIDGVTVKTSNQEKTINVTHARERSLDFKFKWTGDHFIGYFVDSEGSLSQAVLSLWTPMDAIYFAVSYSLLVSLRASRASPL